MTHENDIADLVRGDDSFLCNSVLDFIRAAKDEATGYCVKAIN